MDRCTHVRVPPGTSNVNPARLRREVKTRAVALWLALDAASDVGFDDHLENCNGALYADAQLAERAA